MSKAEVMVEGEAHYGLEARVADILRREIRLTLKSRRDPTEPDDMDVWQVKSGNIDHCAKLISELVWAAMASGDIAVRELPIIAVEVDKK